MRLVTYDLRIVYGDFLLLTSISLYFIFYIYSRETKHSTGFRLTKGPKASVRTHVEQTIEETVEEQSDEISPIPILSPSTSSE